MSGQICFMANKLANASNSADPEKLEFPSSEQAEDPKFVTIAMIITTKNTSKQQCYGWTFGDLTSLLGVDVFCVQDGCESLGAVDRGRGRLDAKQILIQ